MDTLLSNFRLTFLYVDQYTFSEKWSYPESITPYCMYRYIVSGSALFMINGQSYRVQKDDVFYIPNGSTLECHAIESIQFISVRFVAPMELQGSNILHELFGIPMLNPIMDTQMKGYFEELYRSAIGTSKAKLLRINACLEWITALLAERASGAAQAHDDPLRQEHMFELPEIQRRVHRSLIKQDPRITVVVDYLVTHPKEMPTTEQLCQMINVSQSTLRRLFKAQTGKSPVDFMMELRMMNAARRLLKGDERISDIAYGVGYEQPNYFSRCFKEIFGISPQEYRRRSRLL
ncbi:MAG: helix-turn-helix domain-containing protein [Clostridia bacterium]